MLNVGKMSLLDVEQKIIKRPDLQRNHQSLVG